ncbi:hypothetical protein PP707_04840 [Acetobacter pasteurianus]|nr:hypothetical protein [Acetobacter pasteurianus]
MGMGGGAGYYTNNKTTGNSLALYLINCFNAYRLIFKPKICGSLSA